MALPPQIRNDLFRRLGRLAARLTLARMLASAAQGAVLAALVSAAAELAWTFLAGRGQIPWTQHLHFHKAWIPVVLIPAGWTLALIASLLRPVTRLAAAAWLDARADLRQRLVTAVELARSPSPAASASVVFSQALDALRRLRPPLLASWPAASRTLAALALAGGLCLALAVVPNLVPPPRPDPMTALADAAASMNAADSARLAQALRNAADPNADPALAAQWLRAAHVVEVKDARELQRILQDLRAAGGHVLAAVPPDLLARAGLAGASDANSADANAPARRPDDSGHPRLASDANASSPTGPSFAGNLRVYDPLYRLPAAASAAGEANLPFSDSAAPFADAWSAACARAQSAALHGQVPPDCRQLVRDFFSE